MNVLMRHWHDLLHQSWGFFFLHLFYQCPSHTNHNLVPTPVCRVCQRIQTSDTETGHLPSELFFFFFFSPPLSCRCSLLGMQEGDRRAAKSYTDENWRRFLFVSSAIPCGPPSHFSSGVTSFLFFFFPPPVLLEPCQQTPLDRHMQILWA